MIHDFNIDKSISGFLYGDIDHESMASIKLQKDLNTLRGGLYEITEIARLYPDNFLSSNTWFSLTIKSEWQDFAGFVASKKLIGAKVGDYVKLRRKRLNGIKTPFVTGIEKPAPEEGAI